MTLEFHPRLVCINLCSELHLLAFFQLLSVTCNNAAPNDTMIDELAKLWEEFPGVANHTHCFTHILNLVAKSVMKQFDLPKVKAGEVLDAAAQALTNLAGDIEGEELAMGSDLIGDEDEDNNNKGLADVHDGMSEEEIVALDATLQPVRLVLVKVNSVSASIL